MADAVSEMKLSHGQLMSLLYAMHGGVTDDQKSKIQNRYKNLRKVGLPSGDKPARGTREKYTFRQVCEIVLAFEMAQHWRVDAGTIERSRDQFMDAAYAFEGISLNILDNVDFLTICVHFERMSLEAPDEVKIGVYLGESYKEDVGQWKMPPQNRRSYGRIVLEILAEDMLEVFAWAKKQP